MSKKAAVHYVDKAELYNILCQWKAKKEENIAKGLPPPPSPNEIGAAILKIVNGTAQRPNFRNYTYIDEMVGDAIEHCVKAVNKFDPDRLNKDGEHNPFGFLSLVAWRAFTGRIAKEKKRQEKKVEMMVDPSHDYFSQSDFNHVDIDQSQVGQFLYESNS